MPYYSDLGMYSSPTTPTYSTLYLTGPYANHSSIIASNYTRPLTTSVPRNISRYKPHLATISESQSIPLRRLHSPKLLLHSSPKYKVPRPIKINTADIDVSVNKYRKSERPSRGTKLESDRLEKRSQSKSKSPSPSKVIKKEDNAEEDIPRSTIRRDRPTVRLHTVHKKRNYNKEDDKESTKPQSWRENFNYEELNTEEKRYKKTPGEILKEKHLIKNYETEELPQPPPALPKSPSFHDICRVISSDTINEDLNPGQSDSVKRKQSKHSDDEVMKQIKRSSAEILKEEVTILDKMLEKVSENETKKATKKKIAKKKSNENVNLEQSDIPNSTLQRRLTQKKIRRNSSELTLADEAYNEVIKDISQVEIEEIKTKPKPIITGEVNIEKSKPNLKAVIANIEVKEEVVSPKTKKPALKLNFTVSDIIEKRKTVIDQRGRVQLPKPKHVVITDLLNKRSMVHSGRILEDIKEVPVKEQVINEIKDVPVKEQIINEIIEVPVKQQVISEIKEEPKPQNAVLNLNNFRQSLKVSPKTFLNIQDPENMPDVNKSLIKDENDNTVNFWDIIDTRESVYYRNRRNASPKRPSVKEQPIITQEEVKEGEDEEEIIKKMMSKRSLVYKTTEVPDPDMEVFIVPPEPEPEPEPEPPSNKFVPLQSNRLSQWMHPFQKPPHFDECPVEIYARPKTIRKRHYPRPRHGAPPPPIDSSSDSSDSDDSSDDDSDETSDEDENVTGKVGASTSSNDSGFDSAAPGSNRRNKG